MTFNLAELLTFILAELYIGWFLTYLSFLMNNLT